MPAPEFSRPVALARIGREPLVQRLEASRSEREALARRFGLLALDRLAARASLRRDGERILLQADFEAAFVQECVVSLEPVQGAVAESFALIYGPPEAEPAEPDPAAQTPTFEPLGGDSVDIGEAVAQELSLALPVSPRLPEAAVDGIEAADPEARPFAALRRLSRP